MGGSVSSGQNNEELIDNLVEGGLIKSQLIERAFRCVDRGIFFLPEFKERAYRDLAWREGNIHISAPCVYTKVLENLELRENLSFLNIGSGTGYLSSIVGLILGANGVNHNIEIHKELITYAMDGIKELVKSSTYFDEFDFSVPTIVHGDCMNLKVTQNSIMYDRIYVGACVSQEQEQFITNFLKVGGILVMPSNDSLVKIRKIDENCVSKHSIMNVSFASLITCQIEKSHPDTPFSMPRINPPSLQELCRFKIRKTIRETIEAELPEYYLIKREKSNFNTTKKVESTKQYAATSTLSSYLNDSQNESDSEETDRPNYPITRFERIFSPYNSNLDFGSNNFEHQIRLMIYGHLLDAANSSLQLAVNASDEINNSESDSDNEQETNNAVAHTNENKDNEGFDQESSSGSFKSFLGDYNISSQKENDDVDSEESDAASEADLFELFAENCRKARSSGFSSTSSIENTDNQVISLDSPVTSKSLNYSSNSSHESEFSDELDDGIGRSWGDSMASRSYNGKVTTIIKRKRNSSSGYTSSSNECSSSLTETTEPMGGLNKATNPKDMKRNYNLKSHVQNLENDLSKQLDKQKKPVKINLLRERILVLPLSMAMKNFLLYHRKI